MNILLATIIGLSFSVRTPNDATKPLDYEFAVKASREAGKFQYFLKRDWERELGEEYVDTQIEVTETVNVWYAGVKYIDKQSKFYEYRQARMGFDTKIMKIGIAISGEGETLANFTFKKILKKDTFEYKIYLDFTSDLKTEIWDIKSEVRKYLNKYVNVYAMFNKEFYNGQVDEQYKVGLGVKF
tara:strand:- start:684 stop:1235 length:552 start_codon:yes stop_codon:yes gene_type:complete